MLLKSPPALQSNSRQNNNTPKVDSITNAVNATNNNSSKGCNNLKSINNSKNINESAASIAKIKTPQSITGIFKSNFRTVLSKTPTSNLLVNNARTNNSTNSNGNIIK